VIAWLVDELVELGHDVTLFASGDSKTKGKLHPVWPRALRLGRRGADPNAACALLIEAIAERSGVDLHGARLLPDRRRVPDRRMAAQRGLLAC
jgi:hypothetical protein